LKLPECGFRIIGQQRIDPEPQVVAQLHVWAGIKGAYMLSAPMGLPYVEWVQNKKRPVRANELDSGRGQQ